MQESETFDETLDAGEDAAPYLVPRLSAYAPPSPPGESADGDGRDGPSRATSPDEDAPEPDEDAPGADDLLSEDSPRAAPAEGPVENGAAVFPAGRLRELLRAEGGVVSREAAIAAGEATALLLRDLASAAAAEAALAGRRTITYDDVSRLARLFDRFSFLREVLPAGERSGPLPSHGSLAARAPDPKQPRRF